MPHKPEDKEGADALRRAIGGRVRAARESRGWSQETLAEKVGVGTEMLGRYERGLKFPSHLTLLRLADTLDMTTDTLYGVAPKGARRNDALGRLANALANLNPTQQQAVAGIVREMSGANARAARHKL